VFSAPLSTTETYSATLHVGYKRTAWHSAYCASFRVTKDIFHSRRWLHI